MVHLMTLTFKVNANDQQLVFSETEDQTLLQCLHNNGIKSTHHCKDGFCGTCRARLKSGSIKYLKSPLASLREGEILTCCTKPSSDLEIEVSL